MIEIKAGSLVKQGVPPAFRERCAIRCTDKKFGPNKKGDKQMITSNWELIGYFDKNNVLQTKIQRGEIIYKLDGLKLSTTYHPITEDAIVHYADFYSKANHGEVLTQIDEQNAEAMNEHIKYFDGLVMQAIVQGKMAPVRRILTDEEKEADKANGGDGQGEVLTDDEGKPIENAQLNVIFNGWLKKYTGEIPEGVDPSN